MDRELLRKRDNLIVGGKGIIALEVWSILKIIITIILKFEDYFKSMTDSTDAPKELVYAAAFIVIGAIIVVSLVIRSYIGRSAIAEGRGAKKGNGYVIVAGVITLIDVVGMIINVMSVTQPENSIIEVVAVFILDATVIFIQTDLIVSAMKVRKMTAEAKEGE